MYANPGTSLTATLPQQHSALFTHLQTGNSTDARGSKESINMTDIQSRFFIIFDTQFR